MIRFVSRIFNPLAKVLLFYALSILVFVAVVFGWPSSEDYIPLGGLGGLIADPSTNSLSLGKLEVSSGLDIVKRVSVLSLAMIGACLMVTPVVMTYRQVFEKENGEGPLISMLFILPVLISSIVFIVQHSLALAFSLAGIVVIVRFRFSIKSIGDVPYVIAGIGIGLAAGIGALGLSAVIGTIFCSIMLVLWALNLGHPAPSSSIK